MNDQIKDIFAVLDMVVLQRSGSDSFKLVGPVPDWFLRFHPDSASKQLSLRQERFSYLESFLTEAEDLWKKSKGRLKSGIWTESDSKGNEYHLEAQAICFGKRKILLIESLGEAYKETQSILQRARQISLDYEKLTKEMEKKEILLHFIVHDLAGPLSGIKASLSFITSDKGLGSEKKKLLEIALRQSNKLERLIQEILDIFSMEAKELGAFTYDPEQAPDALLCAKEVIEALSPAFLQRDVKLQLSPEIDLKESWKITGEKSHLERIFFNLIENALRYSPQGSLVRVGLKKEEEFILVAVDDEGSGIPEEMAKSIFQKFPREEKSGKAGLGLYFCRLVVERWGGKIGYSPLNQGGTRFWVQLPKAQ